MGTVVAIGLAMRILWKVTQIVIADQIWVQANRNIKGRFWLPTFYILVARMLIWRLARGSSHFKLYDWLSSISRDLKRWCSVSKLMVNSSRSMPQGQCLKVKLSSLFKWCRTAHGTPTSALWTSHAIASVRVIPWKCLWQRPSILVSVCPRLSGGPAHSGWFHKAAVPPLSHR